MNEARIMRPEEAGDMVAVDGPLVVVRCMSPSCDSIIQTSLDAVEVVIATGGRPVMLIILGPKSAPPGVEMRATLAKHRRRYDGEYAAAAYVLEGAGFGVAVHRSVISAMQLEYRARNPERLFATTEEAADWLAQYVPDRTATNILGVARGRSPIAK